MIRWKIYYDNGATFSDEDGSPGDAPATGVVAINQRLDCGHHPIETFKSGEDRLFGEDWYWWRDDLNGWLQGTHDGMLDQIMHCGARFVKQGRMCGHVQWEAIWIAVASDPAFPR